MNTYLTPLLWKISFIAVAIFITTAILKLIYLKLSGKSISKIAGKDTGARNTILGSGLKKALSPHGFIFGFLKKNKVYLATTNNKNVYKHLKKCPYVSFLSHSKDYLSFISVNGNIHFTDDINLKTRVLNEYPEIKELFKTPDNPIFELFYINVEEIRTFDLKTYTNENFKIEKP